MSLDPDERLEALRREVLAEQPTPPVTSAGPSAAPPGPSAVPPPVPPEPALPGPPDLAPPPSAAPPMSVAPSVPATVPSPPVGPASDPTTPTEAPSGPAGGLLGALADVDLRDLLADRSLASWMGIGLLVVGGYLVLSWIVPGIAIIGSLALLLAGIALLYAHLVRGAPPWALYAGAALAGMGGARMVGALLPGEWHGATAIGVGIAFLAIGYLRHSQAGGYGWQGVVGGAAIALGVVQMVLGWLPGSPGVFDLLTPALVLVVGVVLVLGARRMGGGGNPHGGV